MGTQLKGNLFYFIYHIQELLKVTVLWLVDTEQLEPLVTVVPAKGLEEIEHQALHGLLAIFSD